MGESERQLRYPFPGNPVFLKVSKGVWKDGKWSVVFFRTLDTINKWDIDFDRKIPVLVAFAVWDGKHQDRNGRKVISMWQRLKVPLSPPAVMSET